MVIHCVSCYFKT